MELRHVPGKIGIQSMLLYKPLVEHSAFGAFLLLIVHTSLPLICLCLFVLNSLIYFCVRKKNTLTVSF